jgi:hypothetical protein
LEVDNEVCRANGKRQIKKADRAFKKKSQLKDKLTGKHKQTNGGHNLTEIPPPFVEDNKA